MTTALDPEQAETKVIHACVDFTRRRWGRCVSASPLASYAIGLNLCLTYTTNCTTASHGDKQPILLIFVRKHTELAHSPCNHSLLRKEFGERG